MDFGEYGLERGSFCLDFLVWVEQGFRIELSGFQTFQDEKDWEENEGGNEYRVESASMFYERY